jgi:hypothetical protein
VVRCGLPSWDARGAESGATRNTGSGNVYADACSSRDDIRQGPATSFVPCRADTPSPGAGWPPEGWPAGLSPSTLRCGSRWIQLSAAPAVCAKPWALGDLSRRKSLCRFGSRPVCAATPDVENCLCRLMLGRAPADPSRYAAARGWRTTISRRAGRARDHDVVPPAGVPITEMVTWGGLFSDDSTGAEGTR